ncbi:MAG: hypothetical protein NC548_01375 [Lachnospiraceae bacterium]|nr:hypothetical protein [Lachnospiraceae bacterium]
MLMPEGISQRNSKSHTEESQEQRFFPESTDSVGLVCAAGGGMTGSVKIKLSNIDCMRAGARKEVYIWHTKNLP